MEHAPAPGRPWNVTPPSPPAVTPPSPSVFTSPSRSAAPRPRAAPSFLVERNDMSDINMEVVRLALSGQFNNTTIHCSDGAIKAPAWLVGISSSSLYDALREAQEEEPHVVSPDSTAAEIIVILKDRLYQGLEKQVSMVMACDDHVM